jgi:hypothetical protein
MHFVDRTWLKLPGSAIFNFRFLPACSACLKNEVTYRSDSLKFEYWFHGPNRRPKSLPFDCTTSLAHNCGTILSQIVGQK